MNYTTPGCKEACLSQSLALGCPQERAQSPKQGDSLWFMAVLWRWWAEGRA